MTAAARSEALLALIGPGGEYEVEELRVRSGSLCRTVKRAPRTMLDLLTDTRRFSGLEYMAYLDEVYTFADIERQTARLATVLAGLGVRKGDRVAVCMRNGPEWPAVFFAPMALGAVTVSLNGWWSGEEIEYGIRDAGATVLIADCQRLQRVAGNLGSLGVRAIAVRDPSPPAGVVDWQTALAAASETDLSSVDADPDDDCLMLYTSGSTSGPKAAVSTHRNIIHALMGWEIEVRAQAQLRGETVPAEPTEVQYRMLVTIPFFHVTACHVCMLSGLRHGRRLTVMYKWDVDEALDLIERDRITHFVSVPTVTGDLVRAAAASGRTLPSLLAIGGGGSHRPVQQVREIPEVFENARPGTGWGMTETNAIGTQITAPDYMLHPTSSGRCSVLMDMKIVDPDSGDELPPGETGEVLVRGTPVVRGYWNKPVETAQAFSDGWFRTGDLAYIDEDEFVHFVDRIKEIVIRGGENISCGKVEDALYECDGVEEAVVFGVPNERLGEELTAVVVPREGCRLTEDGVRSSMRERLARFEVPERIVLSDSPLPRIATGKFAKRRIRAKVVASMAQAG